MTGLSAAPWPIGLGDLNNLTQISNNWRFNFMKLKNVCKKNM